MCSCDEGFCTARHFPAPFQDVNQWCLKSLRLSQLGDTGAVLGVCREWGRCWHQSAFVCETQSITNSISLKEPYLLPYSLKRLFGTLKCALTKNQERQVAFLPSPQTLTSTGVTWGLIKMQIWVLQVWPGPGILWVFFFLCSVFYIRVWNNWSLHSKGENLT